MGLHTVKEIDTNGFKRYWAESSRTVASKGDLRGYWEEISHAEGRKRGSQMSGGYFITRLADHFGFLTKETHVPEVANGTPHAEDEARLEDEADGGISQLLDSARATYMRYSETHVPYQRRRVRQKSGEASTSEAPLDKDQPEP
ncbi:hypothetical protein Tco_0793278 [Tanacetum coccineum]